MSGPKHLWSGDWQDESAAASDELARRRVSPVGPEPATSTPSQPRARAGRRPAATPPEPPPTGPRRHGLRRRAIPLGLAALLLVAAAAYGVTALLGSDGRRASTTARVPSGARAFPTVPFVPPAQTIPPAPSVPPIQTIPAPQVTPPTPTTPSPSVPPATTVTPPPATTPIPPRPVNWLGMEIQTVSPGAAVIDTVAAGSPAALAGLQPGEFIVAINHRAIHGTSDIAPAIRGLRTGDAVQLQIIHGSGLRGVAIPLSAPPSAYP